jgi:hypothetical protein
MPLVGPLALVGSLCGLFKLDHYLANTRKQKSQNVSFANPSVFRHNTCVRSRVATEERPKKILPHRCQKSKIRTCFVSFWFFRNEKKKAMTTSWLFTSCPTVHQGGGQRGGKEGPPAKPAVSRRKIVFFLSFFFLFSFIFLFLGRGEE